MHIGGEKRLDDSAFALGGEGAERRGRAEPAAGILAEPVEAAHIVLWFPRLPQDSDGRNRVILNEVVLAGPAG